MYMHEKDHQSLDYATRDQMLRNERVSLSLTLLILGIHLFDLLFKALFLVGNASSRSLFFFLLRLNGVRTNRSFIGVS